MDTSSLEINVEDFKKAMEEECTEENCWKSIYDGVFRKDFSNSTLKVWKKKAEGETVITMSMEGIIQGLKLENFVRMLYDTELAKKAKPAPKEFRIVETINKNLDYVYIHMPLPFPMSDRDYVQQRLLLNNKDDAELVKQLGLYDKEHKYYVFMVKSVERSDCPEINKLIRAEIKFNYWIFEEVPGEENSFTFKTRVCQALNGSVPLLFINDIGPKMAPKMMGDMLDNYKRIYGDFDKN